jgi:hypothetical protein
MVLRPPAKVQAKVLLGTSLSLLTTTMAHLVSGVEAALVALCLLPVASVTCRILLLLGGFLPVKASHLVLAVPDPGVTSHSLLVMVPQAVQKRRTREAPRALNRKMQNLRPSDQALTGQNQALLHNLFLPQSQNHWRNLPLQA